MNTTMKLSLIALFFCAACGGTGDIARPEWSPTFDGGTDGGSDE